MQGVKAYNYLYVFVCVHSRWVKDSSASQFVPAVTVVHKLLLSAAVFTELLHFNPPSSSCDDTVTTAVVTEGGGVPRIEITITNPRDSPMKITLIDSNSTQHKSES